jgi:virulence factor Mce-like protein
VRRLTATIAFLSAGAAAATIGVLAVPSGAGGSSSSRFDVIFDNARGLVGGQLVEIAGAQAGTIEKVVVTPDFKARIEAALDSRFMPFHADATCSIKPAGLIAENYVECDPGSAGSPLLQPSSGHPPTVPVTQTTEPVAITDLFNTFHLPAAERLSVILQELGIATAGRGQDLNAIVRRANPALAFARRAISEVAAQRAQLAAILDTTNTIARVAAGHTRDLQTFLDRAASVTSVTAAHSTPLAEAMARLPGLLAAAQPALRQIDAIAIDGTPLVQEVHVAAPDLNRLQLDLRGFAHSASPALTKLGGALRRAVPAIRAATPLLGTIRRFLGDSLPATKQIGALLTDLQQHGFVESLLSVVYYVAAASARYDSLGHIAVASLMNPGNGACLAYASTPVRGCSAHFGSAPLGAATPPPAQPPPTAPAATTAQARATARTMRTLRSLSAYLLR